MLQKFNSPKVDAWESEDYVSAMEVLIDFYVGGPDTVPALADISRLLSEKIRNDRSKKQEAQKRNNLQRNANESLRRNKLACSHL